MTVRRANTRYRFGSIDSLGFEHVTFVPFGNKLVDRQVMTKEDKAWLNAYHQECRDVLEPLLVRDSKTLAWIERETEPL